MECIKHFLLQSTTQSTTMVERIIDLSPYVIDRETYANIKSSRKTNMNTNIISHIFTDQVYDMFNLDPTQTKWIIQYKHLLFILDLIPNDSQRIIRIRSSNLQHTSAILKLIKPKP